MGIRSDNTTVNPNDGVTDDGARKIQPADPLMVNNGTVGASGLNQDVIPSTDVGNCTDVSIQIFGTWVGTLTFQGSNDNVNWNSAIAYAINSGGYQPSPTTNTNNMFIIPTGFKYIRARITSYTSGTILGVMMGNKQPTPMMGVGGAIVVYSGSLNISLRNSSGAASYKRLSTADTNGVNVKSAAASLFNVFALNTGASTRYLKLYNKATSPVVGTDVPVMVFPLPPNVPVSVPLVGVAGVNFSGGIGIAITGGMADADTTAVALNEVSVVLAYT